MDTDELSKMAWAIIGKAAQVSDTLKAELGAMSGRCENEDDWLREIQDHLQGIIAAPEEYMEYWGLEEHEGLTAIMISDLAAELSRQAEKVHATPLGQRDTQGGE